MTQATTVTLLGTKGGPAIRPGSAMPTSTLIRMDGAQIVVDCGLGVTRGLTDAGMALADLRLILITHLHSDHYLELGPLLHTAWTAGLSHPVEIWGPKGLDIYVRQFLASMEADITLRCADEGRPDLAGLLRVHEITEGALPLPGAVQIEALRVKHPPLRDCFALGFRGTRHVVMSGDTAYFPPLARFAAGADLLVHEAMLPEAVEALVARVGNGDDRLRQHLRRSHSTAAEAAQIAQAAGVKRLALHHLIPADDPAYGLADWEAAVRPHWAGPLDVGRDGMVIPL